MWRKILQYVALWSGLLLNAVLILASLYLIWGWITISDIKTDCRRKGLDAEKVLDSMVSRPGAGFYYNYTNAETKTSFNWHTEPAPPQPDEFRRLNAGFQQVSFGKIGEVSMTELGFLDFFLHLSENVLNVLFCFGVGYAISSVIVLLKCLKKGQLEQRYYIIRPIAGGAVSAELFLIVLSGGTLMWHEVSSVNGLSIGVFAAIGGLYCERFEKMLSASLKKGEQGEYTAQPAPKDQG